MIANVYTAPYFAHVKVRLRISQNKVPRFVHVVVTLGVEGKEVDILTNILVSSSASYVSTSFQARFRFASSSLVFLRRTLSYRRKLAAGEGRQAGIEVDLKSRYTKRTFSGSSL